VRFAQIADILVNPSSGGSHLWALCCGTFKPAGGAPLRLDASASWKSLSTRNRVLR